MKNFTTESVTMVDGVPVVANDPALETEGEPLEASGAAVAIDMFDDFKTPATATTGAPESVAVWARRLAELLKTLEGILALFGPGSPNIVEMRAHAAQLTALSGGLGSNGVAALRHTLPAAVRSLSLKARRADAADARAARAAEFPPAPPKHKRVRKAGKVKTRKPAAKKRRR